MKKTLSALAAAALISVGAVTAQAAEDKTAAAPEAAQSTPLVLANPFDPKTWHDAGAHAKPGHKVEIKPADPEFWAQFVNPKTHTGMHMAFTNPATYGQMMNPGFYMAMMNPATWMKWMNPQSYQVFMQPTTYTYWMQPGAYMHGMNPAGYMQAMNPDNYTKMMAKAKIEDWTKPTSYTAPASTASTEALPNMFNPMAWMNMFATGMAAGTGSKDKS